MQNFDPAPDPAPEWERIGPVLDEAMSQLGDEDREALLLRFFRSHDFRTIGQSLGVSDDAAQKRVTRALEKLRVHLTSRGVTASAAALGAALSAHVVQAAPVGLATILSNAALAGSTLGAIATVTAAKTVAMTTLQKIIIGATLAVAVGTGVYEARQASVSCSQVQALRQQQEMLAEQSEQLTRERDSVASKVAVLQNDNERLRHDLAELSRLRVEVARLRVLEQQSDQSKVSAPAGSDDPFTRSVLAVVQRAEELNHNGQLPADISQLKPYFEVPVDNEMLQRYEVLQTGAADGLNGPWVLGEKGPADWDFDSHLYVGPHAQWGAFGTGGGGKDGPAPWAPR
jgi:hypothetical protein